MKKRLLSLFFVAALTLTLSGVVNAANSESQAQPSKSVDIVESTNYYTPSIANEPTKVTKIDVKGVDKETGSIINEDQFKKSLLNFFNSNPEKYSTSIKE
ncbi:hypothetical protein SAMN04487895_11435 [Paenibacillus sophorae]|uniref:Uncharacterized protein n=1 Tax=Paenibacillus sophorae TaxID=1333845 RepID=A0A1H8TG49_9BACL|nr:hypothetical protein [Paenibacillus sophorae]QWU16194.1 hypothetical protein KP014_02680 [Paenibacillus sophorae]SEO90109.1 hypothetical protein SAMN04487895_11435 [Paenibacillus sophorae]